MSNLGLGNLADLKTHCLQAAAGADTQWDDVFAGLGKGAAKAMQNFCNRDFERSTAVVDEFTADRAYWITRRHPIESVVSIHQRDSMAEGWIALTVNDVIVNRGDDRGLLEFGTVLGTHESRIKVTYAGGYWFDTAEDYSTALPSGATRVPDDLKLAWLTQVNAWFLKRDKLNLIAAAGANPEAGAMVAALAGRALEPEVALMLQPFRRYV